MPLLGHAAVVRSASRAPLRGRERGARAVTRATAVMEKKAMFFSAVVDGFVHRTSQVRSSNKIKI